MPDTNTVTCPIVTYTDGFRWSGDVKLPPTIRMSDFLNDSNSTLLIVENVTLSAWGLGATRELTKIEITAVVKSNIIAIFASPEAPNPPRNNLEYVAKAPQRVMAYAPPFAVIGNLHIVRNSTWLDTLRAMRRDFIGLTDVSFFSFDARSTLNQSYPFGLVNMKWVAALHPLGLPETAKVDPKPGFTAPSWSRLSELDNSESRSRGDKVP